MLFEIREIPPGASESEKSILARRALGALLAEYYGITVLPRIEKDANGKPFSPTGLTFTSRCRIARPR